MAHSEFDKKVREDDNISVVKWKDNKYVILLSSHSASEPLTSCKRWSKEEHKKIDVPQPQVVHLYNDE